MFLFKRAEAPLTKIPAATAAEVLKKFKPEPAAQALLVSGQTPGDFFQVLEKNPQAGEAVKFLAHGLPEREAVWWACQSARVVAIGLNQADRQALAAAEKWVKAPSAENRAEAEAAAAKTDMTGPGGWAAQAAAWSQLPAPIKPAASESKELVDPTAGLTAPAVAGAILLAAGLVGKAAMPEVKSPELKTPAVATPKVPSVNASLPGMPGVPAMPGIAVAVPAVSAPAMPSLAMPGKPALSAPQAPGLSLSAPAISVPQMPTQSAAPQVPGVPQVQAPGLNLTAPALPGMPSVPTIAKPEIPAVDQKKLAKMLKPFLELGRDVASGKNAWA
jgi:hypothetical protein